MPSSADLVQHFETVTDPRPGKPIYPLTNILFLAVCAVIGGGRVFSRV